MAATSLTFKNVFQKLKGYNISEILLITILISTFLGGHAINSIAVILFFLVSLYFLITNKPKLKFSKTAGVFILFYVICILSLFWTDNLENTKTGLIRFLSFLVVPLAFIFNSDVSFNQKKIIDIFSKSLVFFGLYAIVIAVLKSFIKSDFSYLFYHKLSNNLGDLNAIYLSVFVFLGISFFLQKKEKSKIDFFYLLFLIFFLILLSSKLIISISFLMVLFFLLKKKKYKKINLKYFFLIIGIALLFLLASSNLSKRVKVEFEKTKITEVLNKKDFGHVYIWTGVGLRLFQIKAFLEILQEEKRMFLGYGLNNSQNSLNNKYKEYNLYPGFLNYNYHNQYLQIVAELGVLGLCLMLLIFSLILKDAIIYKDYFLLSFIILILVVCITESFLWRQRGMVFFLVISLLFSKKKYSI